MNATCITQQRPGNARRDQQTRKPQAGAEAHRDETMPSNANSLHRGIAISPNIENADVSPIDANISSAEKRQQPVDSDEQRTTECQTNVASRFDGLLTGKLKLSQSDRSKLRKLMTTIQDEACTSKPFMVAFVELSKSGLHLAIAGCFDEFCERVLGWNRGEGELFLNQAERGEISTLPRLKPVMTDNCHDEAQVDSTACPKDVGQSRETDSQPPSRVSADKSELRRELGEMTAFPTDDPTSDATSTLPAETAPLKSEADKPLPTGKETERLEQIKHGPIESQKTNRPIDTGKKASAESVRANKSSTEVVILRIAQTETGQGELLPHTLANAFPAMSKAQLDDLAEDIKKHGLRDPITTLEGQILDGRCRYKACFQAGIKPILAKFGGPDPVSFVLSRNVHRRHLTASQRASIAADLLPRYEEEAQSRKRKLSGNRSNKDGTKPKANREVVEKIPQPARAREQAAKALDVNPRYVADAARIKEKDPDLHQQLKEGTTTLQAAKKKVAKQRRVARSSQEDCKPPTFNLEVRREKLNQIIEQESANWLPDHLPELTDELIGIAERLNTPAA